jgi:hypothetical protein
MPYTRRTYHRKLASWLAPFVIASLLLSGFALPGAQAAPQALLASPSQPTLVSPANGASGVASSSTLSDSITDPASNPVAVNAAPDFTLVVVPDPQNLATSYPAVYNSQTQWAVDHKTSSNVVFVTAVGDLVNTSSSDTEYGRADAAFDILDAGNVPYSVGPGNHDIAFGTTLWENYFSASRFSGKSWYGGAYAANGYNTYSLFSASGMDFILINLQYNPSAAQITWANNLLQTYSSRRGIVEQHDILNTNDSWNNQTSYNTLRGNANLFLMLCGHMHAGTDGAAYVAGTGTDGHTIHVVMQDYQDFTASGNTGFMRIYRFSPANDMIYMTTYSPYTGGSITTSPDQMNLAYVMPDAPLALPQAPVVTSISQSGGNVALGWTAVTQDMNGNPPMIDAYHVYGSQAPYFTSGTLLTPTSAATTFTHTGGATGTTNWYYLVRAHNAVGESADSARRTGRFGFALVPGS